MRRLALSGLAVMCVVGCGATTRAPTTARSASGEPLTVVEFADETSWPFELASVAVALDGHQLVGHRAAPGDASKLSFQIPLEGVPEGEHVLSVAVSARFSSTRLIPSEGCAVSWRQQRTVVLGAEPVGVRIVADTDDVVSRFVNRLDVSIDVAGAVASTEHAVPARRLTGEQTACFDHLPLPFADEELATTRFSPGFSR